MAKDTLGIKVNLQALNGAFLKNLTGRTQTFEHPRQTGSGVSQGA